RQIGEALESAGITDYFIDQDNGTIETEYLDSSSVGKESGQICTKINEHATRFEEAARKIYDIIPTADYVTSKSVGIRRVRVQDSTLQRAEQAQGDIQEVSKTEKLSEINQELNKIREENPDQFRKDGMPKKNSKVFPAYMALSKERDAIAQEAISEFPELSRKEKEKSKEETAILNKEFEERRAELEKSLPEGDRVQAIIEEKMEYGQKLTPEEV